MAIVDNDTLTPREYVLLQHEQEESRLAREHDLRVRELDIQAKREEFAYRRGQAKRANQHERRLKELELALRQTEIKWRQLVRVPLIIARWPVYPFLGVGFCLAMLRKFHPKEDFWKLIKG